MPILSTSIVRIRHRFHWFVPVFFSSLVGYEYMSIATSAWSYFVDTTGIYSASATAATVLLRNAGAACLPPGGPALAGKVDRGVGTERVGSAGLRGCT